LSGSVSFDLRGGGRRWLGRSWKAYQLVYSGVSSVMCVGVSDIPSDIAFYYQSSPTERFAFLRNRYFDARTSPVFLSLSRAVSTSNESIDICAHDASSSSREREVCVCWLRFSLLHMSVVFIPSFHLHLPFLKIKIKIKINKKKTTEQAAAVGTPDFLRVFRRGICNNNNNNNIHMREGVKMG